MLLRWLADAVNDTATIRGYMDSFAARSAHVQKDLRRLESDLARRSDEYEKLRRKDAHSRQLDEDFA